MKIAGGGGILAINDSAEARYHSNWCSMMYPRLKLARNLLRPDGVIFISIDDNEVTNTRKLCDEVFGEVNFRNVLYVRRRTKSLNSQFADSGLSSLNVGLEYVLVYAKTENFIMTALRRKKEDAPDRGRWDVFWSNADRPTMRYDVLGFTPSSGQWRTSKEKADVAVANYKKYQAEFESHMSLEEYWKKTGIEDFIRRIPNGTGKNGGVQHWIPPSDTMLRTSNWSDIEVSEISKEFDLPFDNPKNKQLPLELLRLAGVSDDSIVLDFFSGSGTTAHAVMQLNVEDGGNRKFIMVQLPEVCAEGCEAAKAGYKNICEIGKERIRRAGKKIAEELAAKNAEIAKKNEQGELGLENPDNPVNPVEKEIPDIGFRVLKLDSSSLRDTSATVSETTQTFENFDRIRDDRTPDDLLFQMLLETRIPLSEPICKSKVAGNDVFFVGATADAQDKDALSGAPLVACLDHGAKMDSDFFIEIAKLKPGIAFFRDDAFADDSARTNVQQAFDQFSPTTSIKVI